MKAQNSKKSQPFISRLERRILLRSAVRKFKRTVAAQNDAEIYHFMSACCTLLDMHGFIPRDYPHKAAVAINVMNEAKASIEPPQVTNGAMH